MGGQLNGMVDLILTTGMSTLAQPKRMANHRCDYLRKSDTILKTDPSLFAHIKEYTDDVDEGPANDLLSEKRALNCSNYLVSQSIDVKRLNYTGFGVQRPAIPNDTPKNKHLNL